MKKTLFLLTFLLGFTAIAQNDYSFIRNVEPYSVKMIMSEIARNPDGTYLDGRNGQRKWNYTTGPSGYLFLLYPTIAISRSGR